MSLTSVDLPEPETPVTAVNVPSGNPDAHAHEVVLARVVDGQRLAIGRPPRRRRLDRLSAGEIPAGERGGIGHHLVGRAHRHQVPAQLARARPEVHDEIGGADRLLVVLDDEHRVAEVAQALERVEEAAIVALVQPDRRLVQDIEHADQARSDLGGQADALPLAARQRGRGTIERQVVEADLGEKAQALADLLQHAARDRHLPLGQRERLEELPRGSNRKAHDVGDGPARDLDRQRLRAEPRALAGRAIPERHEPLHVRARVLGDGFPIAAVEHLDHALEAVVSMRRRG